jgi:hypothetical protein
MNEHVKALEILHQVWGTMADEKDSSYPGAHWEAMDRHGKPFNHDVSLAHGWSTWPVFLLPRYLVGFHPLEPGWETIGISPVFAGLDEVEYEVESPSRLIKIAIVIDGNRERGTVRVTLPADTTGLISLPNPWTLLGWRKIRGYGEETITESVRK